MSTRFVKTLLVSALALAVAVPIAVGAKGSAPKAGQVQIALTPPANGEFPAANGKAKFKSIGGERELQVEVQDIAVLNGKSVDLYVNGNSTKVASATVALAAARFNLNSDEGDTVPTTVAGKTVVVKIGQTVIVRGTFPS
jgi:FtsP/CotA-like multicopper oxidase with cupredoxin domain